MTVAELIEVLSGFPGELEVHIQSRLACHPDEIHRQVARPAPEISGSFGGSRFRYGMRIPGAVMIHGGKPWYQTPPKEVRVRGPRRSQPRRARVLRLVDFRKHSGAA